MSIESFVSNCNFYDTIHFPHGFARAGTFTRKEADLLTRCGYTINQLALGQMEPQDDAQKAMLSVALGEKEPSTELEKVWQKYQAIARTKVKKFSFLTGGFSASSDNDYSDDQSW